jgi:uncharacterized protein
MLADRLLVFAKAAIPGRVKTRLVGPFTPEEAAAVCEACLHDVVLRSARERVELEIWYADEPGSAAWFAERFAALPRVAQAAGNLGARMADAFARSFAAGASRVVIVGSDVPTLPDATLTAAFGGLIEGDGVVGPSLDGGYCLIGLNRAAWPAAERLFGDVPWSTPGVLSRTLRLAGEIGLDVRVLPGWYDVDRPQDLLRAADDVAAGSNLWKWLEAGARARLTMLRAGGPGFTMPPERY